MPDRFFVIAAVIAYITMTGGWVLLANAQWSMPVLALSTAPLIIMLALMARQRAVVFFYAALLAMPYLATAITQIMIGQNGRIAAILSLGAGLIYLGFLALALRELNRTA